MDIEKDLLTKDLENQSTPEDINKFIEDAELLGHEDIAELGRKKLQEISEKAKLIGESQTSQVESTGGTGEEVVERTKEVDQKIKEVQTEAEQQITEIQSQSEVKTIENQKQVELNELRKQIDSSLDSSPDNLATLCREHQKIEKEIGGDTFFVKNTVGQYVLKNFDKFSKNKLQELVVEFLDNDPSYLGQIEKYGVNENSQEIGNEEVEKIKEQINEMLRKNTEGQEIQKNNSNKINEIMEARGYSSKISELENKITRSEISFGENLIPNKEVGLSNLNKIMATIDSQEERPRKQSLKMELSEIINEISASEDSTLYQSVQRMIRSTHNFKDMISSEDFNALFPTAASSDHYNSELVKEKSKIEDQINNDPEIDELKKQNLEASKLIEDNSSYKIEALQKKLKELENIKNENPAETFNSTEMIKEMTGGSEKIEKFGRGYDNALNMYASSLTNPIDLEKYKDIFSQLAPEDRAKTEKGIIGLKIKNTMLNWGVPEVEAKFSEDIKNYSEMFPKSVESAKMYATMTTPNFNPTKFQEMYNISGSQLREMLQNTKDKMIEDVKKEENIDTKKLLQYYQERIDNTKDSSEKSKLQSTLQDKMNEIMNVTTKNKIDKINEDYLKRVEQVK